LRNGEQGVKPTQSDASRGTSFQSDNPLEQISQEHLRQREVCATLDKLALLTTPDPELAAEVLPHFDTLLARHVHDEEDDLFPILRRRSEPEDDINDTLDRLADKHLVSLELAVKVRKVVLEMANDNVLPNEEGAAALVGFAAHERRHLIVENAIVLPLARARLTQSDLNSLRARMAKRRAKGSS
jgi:hemerythrin-like domain-containing protein